MAHRYDEHRDDTHREERGYSREPRRFVNRAADEVRSWFGREPERHRHDEYERHRRDEHEGHRHAQMRPEPRNEHMPPPDTGWAPERWEGPGRWSGEHDYGYHPAATSGYGERWSRDEKGPGGDDRSSRGGDWRYRERWPGGMSAQADRPAGESRGVYEDDRGRVHQFAHPRQESFAGRGPKGYRRADERIREDVCERLMQDDHIDASEMEVIVANGEVTLSGAVHSRDEKRGAEDLVERISGVRDVHNNLRVSRWRDTDTHASNLPGAALREG